MELKEKLKKQIKRTIKNILEMLKMETQCRPIYEIQRKANHYKSLQ